MKNQFLIIWICLVSISQLSAQCYCEDCPQPIVFNVPSTATINVSGANNNMLGMNGQDLVNVGLSFTHEAAQELSMRIVAPNGSFVDLMIGEGLSFGPTTYFDIDFIPCSGAPSADCTNNPTWTSTDIWNQGPYYGTYFPESGCLEDLTGDVNGQWVLEMNDVFVIEDGELLCFDLTFADGSGISCNFSECPEMPCLAQSGIGITPDAVTAPVGDPSLLIDFVVEYGACEVIPPSPEYIYIFVIYEVFPGPIVEIQQGTVDLTTYAQGQYFVQGFSILASDLPVIEALDFSTSTISDVTNLIQTGQVCGENNFDASLITIDDCQLDMTGTLQSDVITAPVGDPSLDPAWVINWIPASPDFNVNGLYYVVYDQNTGVIVAYLTTNDFTGLPAGEYDVSVLVYSLADEDDLPPIDGVSVFQDILDAINDEDICGFTFGDNQLFITEPCTIDANGILEQEDITAPQNDPLLDPDWDITFGGTPPDPAIYGFYFLVVNADTDQLIAYYTTDNFTLLLSGNYYVVVIYY